MDRYGVNNIAKSITSPSLFLLINCSAYTGSPFVGFVGFLTSARPSY